MLLESVLQNVLSEKHKNRDRQGLSAIASGMCSQFFIGEQFEVILAHGSKILEHTESSSNFEKCRFTISLHQMFQKFHSKNFHKFPTWARGLIMINKLNVTCTLLHT